MRKVLREWWPVAAFFLAGAGWIIWSYHASDRENQAAVARCQSEILSTVSSHEARLSSIEEWLDANRRLPETMARIEANTGNMSARMNEILSEIRDLRRQAMELKK